MRIVLTHEDLVIAGPAGRSVLFFDGPFYRARHGLDADAGVAHFLDIGQHRNWSPHPLLDASWYGEQNPDVVAAGMSAVGHFLRFGQREGRAPHLLFDPTWYSRTVPSGAPAGTALAHFLTIGEAADHDPHPLFDVRWFRARYGADLAPGDNTLAFYLTNRHRRVLDPHPLFHAAWYRARNLDVWKQGFEAFDHYCRFGAAEGRDPHPAFDVGHYRGQAGADGDALRHYVTRGAEAGLSPHPDFDGRWYARRWGDRIAGREPALAHLLTLGRRDRLQAHPSPARSDRLHALLDDHEDPARRTASQPSSPHRPSVVLVTHTLGGGTRAYARDMSRRLAAEGVRVSNLDYVAGEDLATFTTSRGAVHPLDLAQEPDVALLIDLVRREAPRLIHVNQILGAPLVVSALPAHARCDYVVTIHDYYWACPRVTMIDATGRFCASTGTAQCARCIALSGVYDELGREWRRCGTPEAWRATNAAFLAGAVRVLAPSADTAERIEALLGVRATVRPHPVRPAAAGAVAAPPDGVIAIVVIGAIGPHKGSGLLLDCATEAHLRGRPLRFTVIGETDRPKAFAALPNVSVTGRLPPGLMVDEIARHPAHAALFLSPWPETYSYTLTEALQAGLFPVALDIGAIAERIRAAGWGDLIPLQATPTAINDRLERLAVDRAAPPAGLLDEPVYSTLMDSYYDLPTEAGALGA